jgi:protoporphyrinogen oxidase
MRRESKPVETAVIGGGPAGVAAAYELSNRGMTCTLFERSKQIGGLAKTVNFKGFRCDIGPHRFFTKNDEVETLWRNVLPHDLLRIPRLTRIYYKGKYFNYPLKPLNALFGLGFIKSAHVLGSFAYSKLFPRRPEVSFKDWVSNRFGHQLYSVFFETYTEKVWGIPCTELSSDWAAQRIRKLSLGRAVLNSLGIGTGKVTSLIEEFNYPRLGAGQMYETMAEKASKNGAEVLTEHEVVKLIHRDGTITDIGVKGPEGEFVVPVRNVISSMPFTDLAQGFSPELSRNVMESAKSLRYRSIVTVNLILKAINLIPDNWIYIHEPEVRAGRLQLYKNWSPEMVPDPGMTALGFEYFTFEGDENWNMSDADLIEIAKNDLEKLGFASKSIVEDGFVVRYAKAYPMYEGDYRDRLAAIRSEIDKFKNLYVIGRYGQFRYNNMDHSILTAHLAVRKLLGEDADPWSVNEEGEYHEESAS